jgi:hypothetical protein
MADTSDVFVHEWHHDMNLECDTLSMHLGGITVMMHCCTSVPGEMQPVTRTKLVEIGESVQQ